MNNFKYAGSELELFANAANWKSYWSKEIQPYCGLNILEVGALGPQHEFFVTINVNVGLL
jgi:hypothetical protein